MEWALRAAGLIAVAAVAAAWARWSVSRRFLESLGASEPQTASLEPFTTTAAGLTGAGLAIALLMATDEVVLGALVLVGTGVAVWTMLVGVASSASKPHPQHSTKWWTFYWATVLAVQVVILTANILWDPRTVLIGFVLLFPVASLAALKFRRARRA